MKKTFNKEHWHADQTLKSIRARHTFQDLFKSSKRKQGNQPNYYETSSKSLAYYIRDSYLFPDEFLTYKVAKKAYRVLLRGSFSCQLKGRVHKFDNVR